MSKWVIIKLLCVIKQQLGKLVWVKWHWSVLSDLFFTSLKGSLACVIAAFGLFQWPYGCLQDKKYRPWHSTGNAGFRLHFPAHFELVGDFAARRQEEQNRMEQLHLHQLPALSLEACIGQKLQLIGDQFHREHLQQVRGKDAIKHYHKESVW